MFFIDVKKEGKKKGEKVKHDENSQTALLGYNFFFKTQHIHFLVHGHYSWSMFG